MKEFTSHYPYWDVMEQKEHWDPHTREIVEKRIRPLELKSLSPDEASALRQLIEVLLEDSRESILHYVVGHFDNLLSSDIGESQRKKGVPKRSILIREGLRALDQFCMVTHGTLFVGLPANDKRQLADNLIKGSLPLEADGITIPSKEVGSTLLTESVSAYYSHPEVWSEIGYAGPAYPRGYVRSEWGLTDPWEARRNE